MAKKTVKKSNVKKSAKVMKKAKSVKAKTAKAKPAKSASIKKAFKAKPAKTVKATKASKKTKATAVKAKSKKPQAVKAHAKKNTVVTKATVKTAKPATTKTSKAQAASVKATTAVKSNAKIDYSKAITPLGERIVCRLEQAERVTAGGIILPDTVNFKEGFLKGVVLAVGSGTYTKKGHHKLLDVKIGDHVMFPEYAGTKIEFNNEDLFIVNETDVLGTVK